MLVWAHENGCPWSTRTFEYAVKKGDLMIMEYLYANGCGFNGVECIEGAADFGKIEAAKWLIGKGGRFTMNVSWFAAGAGRLEFLQWAVEAGCPYDKVPCRNAIHYAQYRSSKANICGSTFREEEMEFDPPAFRVLHLALLETILK